MGTTTTRLFITSTSTTCAACFIACATASASPLVRWKARLPGASSQIAGRTGGERGHTVDDGRQRLVIDLDQLGCFARNVLAVGHDEGHRIADMAHAALRQRRPRRHDQRLDRRHAGQRAEAVGGEIGRRVDAVHAGAATRPAKRRSARSAHGRAASAARGRTRQPGAVDVGDVAPAADEEPRILEAADRAADVLFVHRVFLRTFGHAVTRNNPPRRVRARPSAARLPVPCATPATVAPRPGCIRRPAPASGGREGNRPWPWWRDVCGGDPRRPRHG